MRIVTGLLKGRVIPSHRSLAEIRLTSSRLKEALFSSLGADLSGRTFLDLCAGSGQIGLEAYSRGAEVVLNEPDPGRCRQIRRLLRRWGISGVELFEVRGELLIPRLGMQNRRFDLVYLDPPYHAGLDGGPLALALVERLSDGAILEETALVLVQHSSGLELPENAGCLAVLRRRIYGGTGLTIYGRCVEKGD